MANWINRAVGTIEEREVLRVFRNRIGDWCAEVIVAHWMRMAAVLDYHPSVQLLHVLRDSGTYIDEDVIAQGAEGVDMRGHARREDD